MSDVMGADAMQSFDFRVLSIDVEHLLRPVDGDDGPAGPSLRYDPAFERIKHARQADNPDLPQGVWETDRKRADWDLVIDEVIRALTHRSKDLQLAAWLTEAAIHRHGFFGLLEGLAVVRLLIGKFWPDLQPLPEDDDTSPTLAPIEWMIDKLPPVLRTLPLTDDQGHDGRQYCLVDWLQSRRESDDEDGIPLRARIRSAFDNTNIAWRQRLLQANERSLIELRAIGVILDDCCGQAAPNFGELRDVLLQCKQFLGRGLEQVMTDHGEKQRATAGLASKKGLDAVALPDGDAAVLEQGIDLGSGHVRGRIDAYSKLAQIADYLIELEPHSPAPYLVRRAVAWGEMPLPQLLGELAREYGDVERLTKSLGFLDPQN
jgi:type VI secretion system protein ImpA